MKKLFKSLFILSLSVVGLSGCSLEEFFGGGKVADHIEVRDYTSEVTQHEKYTFDGKVFAVYEDNSEENVTKKSTISTIDTSTSGIKELSVRYEDSKYIHKETVNIKVNKYIELTDIVLNEEYTAGLGRNKKITPTFVPNNATDTEVTYSIANTSIATISNDGVITPKTLGTTTVTVKSVKFPSVTKTTTLHVEEVAYDEWTVLLYLCGSTLESGGDYGISYGGAATADIQEILSVDGKPDDVNFVIQTGGAAKWKNTYGISSANNQRYHVENRQLVKDINKVYNSYQSMGQASTLKDFLDWGLETYPAKKTGLILWNHGGGLDGVCYDENKSDDCLTNVEVVEAVSGALTVAGLDKLEFIGYDACLMQMMEIAEFNSPYFNYQIASQESEAGSGWDYDTWVDDLYACRSTDVVLQAIVDGFINDNGGPDYQGRGADQTLSYLDLSKMPEFKTAWEAMASQVKSKITSDNKSKFKSNVVEASKYFAAEDYKDFAEFDCYDFLDNLSSNSTFNPGGNYISNARSALLNLVKYNIVQVKEASDAHGLSFYFGKTYNSSTYSHFTNWVSLVSTVGGISSGGGGGGGWGDWDW